LPLPTSQYFTKLAEQYLYSSTIQKELIIGTMAISSYLSLIAFFVFAQAITLTEAQQNIDVFRWVVPYDGPQEFTANVGDTMIFRWAQGVHNVYIHPTMDCNLDGRIVVGSTPGTEYTFVEADGSPEGTDMFFSCDIGDGAHCRAGE